jgi:prepilin-type N-terminal cleavage/methylation domain-containing protein
MNKNRKSVKGMTLVEIIIAMVVFAVTALILVQVGGTVNSLVKHSNHVNKKTSLESPVVENGISCLDIQMATAPTEADGSRDRSKDKETVTVKDGNMLAAVKGNVKVTMEYNSHKVELTGKTFTAENRASGNEFAKTDADLQYIYISKALTSKSNKWIDIEATTEPTT